MILQAEVHVYLQSNMITYIVESQDYELSQLLDELGGVVGLYIGMAIGTFFELLELLCLLLSSLECDEFYDFRTSPSTENA